MIKEVVELDVNVYNDLVACTKLLNALNQAGVDNWEGYEEAMEILEDME